MTQTSTFQQTNSLAGFQPKFHYSRSLSAEQIDRAKTTVSKGRGIVKTVNDTLLEWGYDLLERERDLKASFKNWLAHHFPDAREEARQAMAIASLVNRLPQYINQMMGWNRSALAALSKLDDERVVRVLTSGEKWTVKAIKALQGSLETEGTDPHACATEKDWQRLVWDEYEVEESDRDSLRECARTLAQEDAGEGETEVQVRVGHIKAAVERHKERLLPVLSHRRKGKSGAAPISMKDYNELMDILQTQRKLMREIKEQNHKLIEEQKNLYQKALEQARQEVAEFWEKQKALVGHLRRSEEERKRLELEKQALEAEIAALKASAGTPARQESESGAALQGAGEMSEAGQEEQKELVAQLRRSEEEKEQLVQEKEVLEAEIASLKESAGTRQEVDAGADKKVEADPQEVEADPQEVEEVTASFETVFGERAVRKLHVREILSSLDKPVLETLQLLAEGLRRQAKFSLPFSGWNTRQKAPEFEDDFAFEESQIPPEWDPL